jgi:hypothetical protein
VIVWIIKSEGAENQREGCCFLVGPGAKPERRPVMGEKLSDAVDGLVGYAGEDVFKPGERLDIRTLTGSYETAQHCGCLTADITAKEYARIESSNVRSTTYIPSGQTLRTRSRTLK